MHAYIHMISIIGLEGAERGAQESERSYLVHSSACLPNLGWGLPAFSRARARKEKATCGASQAVEGSLA